MVVEDAVTRCGTGARRRGHQISADPDQDENIISVNERKADIDVRPVMLGATCYIASANDGAPCWRPGRVCI